MGYFVAMGDEQFKKGESVTTGRGGVFFKKEDLVSTLDENRVLQKNQLKIIEVKVPEDAISNKNCSKFGIKSGKNIPVIRIQSFEKAKNEVMVESTVA